jgi:hypothetical protein
MNSNHELGECNSLHAVLNGVPYDLFVMKDCDYNMKLMSSYGRLLPKEGAPDKQRRVNGQIKTIKYCEPFANHTSFDTASMITTTTDIQTSQLKTHG